MGWLAKCLKVFLMIIAYLLTVGVNVCLVQCFNSVINVKAVVAAFNQEKALVGAFSVITNLRMELFQAILPFHVMSPDSGSCSHSCIEKSIYSWLQLVISSRWMVGRYWWMWSGWFQSTYHQTVILQGVGTGQPPLHHGDGTMRWISEKIAFKKGSESHFVPLTLGMY